MKRHKLNNTGQSASAQTSQLGKAQLTDGKRRGFRCQTHDNRQSDSNGQGTETPYPRPPHQHAPKSGVRVVQVQHGLSSRETDMTAIYGKDILHDGEQRRWRQRSPLDRRERDGGSDIQTVGGVLQQHVNADGVQHGRWRHGDDSHFDILGCSGGDELDDDDQERHGQDVVRAIEPPTSAVDGSELWITFEEYPIAA